MYAVTQSCCLHSLYSLRTVTLISQHSNFGKLNYYLGKRAADEGRQTPYAEIDFCKNPEAICSSTKFTELPWIAGMLYWMESVQKYDGGWNYMDKLHEFVDGGFQDRAFIDAVSGIVNRGCHNPVSQDNCMALFDIEFSYFTLTHLYILIYNLQHICIQPCGTGAVDGGQERHDNFIRALLTFKLIDPPKGFESGKGGGSPGNSLVLACGVDHSTAEKACPNPTECEFNSDCPSDQYCWAGVSCQGKDRGKNNSK